MLKRGSGILMHVTSLPSKFGIGDIGPEAYKFVDFLNSAKQRYWQILPLNPTDFMFGNSPYSSISAFGTNTLLISPELMVEEGWLTKADLKASVRPDNEAVDYSKVTEYKNKLFDIAYKNFSMKSNKDKDYQKFCKSHSHWLDDFSVFVVIKTHVFKKAWNEWPKDIRDRNKAAIEKIKEECKDEIEKVKFLQYAFIKQWFELKAYCKQKGVKIIGDLPIYVNSDSVDVWTQPGFFKLDENRAPTVVAGVPPDYFSQTGQRWGNPIYDWDKLKEDNYSWWIKRLKHNLSLFDMVRIDHFRGLIAYWEIPANETTAINGKWVSVPYDDFLTVISKEFPDSSIIAEDLGIITPDVEAAMEKFGLPGMKILLFAFNGDMQTHPYLPHNYKRPCVVYPGTHDNNTIIGWFEKEATDQEKQNFYNYIGERIADDQVHWGFIELAMESKAEISIISAQDILGLNANARMNTPGTVGGNWEWRLLANEIDKEIIDALASLVKENNRI